ncbi:Ni/Fe hydrogenase subunit alpha [Psychromonas sp.]|uniref:Ni/Fe hydrogenase subunit alpha n=1 Tax=Psychromonas sp. TaxID=1884585 RepID=UPI0039E3823E
MDNNMDSNLETAASPDNLKRFVIEPVSRVEGHGKVTLLVDDNNQVKQCRLHIVEFRGFERFIQGRPYWEIPILVQRLCGICPVSHHIAAGKAIDMIAGVTELTETAYKLRLLLHYGQTLQSHALHFFHLSSPDLLFGFESDIASRNIVGVIEKHPDLALQGVKLRKYGQEVIKVICGKRIHGTGCIPGGMNKPLSREDRHYLLGDIEQIIASSESAVKTARDCYLANEPFHKKFALLRSNYLSLVGKNGELDLYHGKLRLKDASGKILFDQQDYCDYQDFIQEEVKSWSYMKFPFIKALGEEKGWYRTGPLARINNCDYIATPLAEIARQEFVAYGGKEPVHATLAYHWARMIEVLFSAEKIKELLNDAMITGNDLIVQGKRQNEGIGVIEAPRGTLFHHYQVGEDDLITKANLIVATTHNNTALNESIRVVASEQINGREISEAVLNNIEVAIRAYDPCLSCATHAMGKMPLKVEMRSLESGELISQLIKNSDGTLYK